MQALSNRSTFRIVIFRIAIVEMSTSRHTNHYDLSSFFSSDFFASCASIFQFSQCMNIRRRDVLLDIKYDVETTSFAFVMSKCYDALMSIFNDDNLIDIA